MRALMLGWDFSPRLSGGVGSACSGLATALARGDGRARTEVAFVLPRVRGDEEPRGVRLLAEADARRAGAAPASRARPPHAPRSAAAAPTRAGRAAPSDPGAVAPAPPDETPTLASPAESLRMLALDSPLRPYLTPGEYAELVEAPPARRHLRLAQPARTRAVVAAAAHPHERAGVALHVRAPAVRAAEDDAARAAPAAAPAGPPPVPVPPYGRTLRDEVERYARAVLALAAREPFDVLHAHDWMTFPAALLVKERTGKPLVVHFHSSEPERRGRGGALDATARAVEQAALDAAERVVCVSASSARVLRAHYAVAPAKLRVVHDAFAPLARPAASPRRRGAAATVLFLGRLSEQKAPDVFLRAAALVRARESRRRPRRGPAPRTRFVLAGDGALYPELRRLARELGIARDVRFAGFVSGAELARTYAGADVYVLSSSAEPFGIGALEALSLGVPTIVPRGAGVTEVVRSVLAFEPHDEADLAERILELLARPALRRRLAAEGLREVRDVRWDLPARAVRGIYDELVPASG